MFTAELTFFNCCPSSNFTPFSTASLSFSFWVSSAAMLWDPVTNLLFVVSPPLFESVSLWKVALPENVISTFSTPLLEWRTLIGLRLLLTEGWPSVSWFTSSGNLEPDYLRSDFLLSDETWMAIFWFPCIFFSDCCFSHSLLRSFSLGAAASIFLILSKKH